MPPRFWSRRADCRGYLEFIYRQSEALHPQAIACITSAQGGGFDAVFGIHTWHGPTVASVKEALFSFIDDHFTHSGVGQ